MATLWITALAKDQATIAALSGELKRYGLEPKGHFWTDDLEKFAWAEAAQEVLSSGAKLWLLIGDAAELAKPTVRYGLSIMALVLRSARGAGFPLVVMNAEADALPPPLRGGLILGPGTAAWQAKLVARAHNPPKVAEAPYRVALHARREVGQWFELGPREGEWSGALFGVAGAEIEFQGVGPAGALPERTSLEYPQKGMKLELGGTEFTAWALRNRLGAGDSHYVKVKGAPTALIFGAYPEGDDPELHVLRLD